MYLVDTNIVSELAKKKPNASVIAWMQDHESEMCLSVITIEEMRFGALNLPEGKRQDMLNATIDAIVEQYGERVWPLDVAAAEQCAAYHVKAIDVGRTPTIEDLMIAAICTCHDATLATRNVKDFDYLGVPVVNPFDSDDESAAATPV